MKVHKLQKLKSILLKIILLMEKYENPKEIKNFLFWLKKLS